MTTTTTTTTSASDEMDGSVIIMCVEKQSFRARASLLLCRTHNTAAAAETNYDINSNNNDNTTMTDTDNNNHHHNVENHPTTTLHNCSGGASNFNQFIRRFQCEPATEETEATTSRRKPTRSTTLQPHEHQVEKLLITPISPNEVTTTTTTPTIQSTTPPLAEQGNHCEPEQQKVVQARRITPERERKVAFHVDHMAQLAEQAQHHRAHKNSSTSIVVPVRMISLLDRFVDDEISVVTMDDDLQCHIMRPTRDIYRDMNNHSVSFHDRQDGTTAPVATSTTTSSRTPRTRTRAIDPENRQGCYFEIIQPFPTIIQDIATTTKEIQQLSKQFTTKLGATAATATTAAADGFCLGGGNEQLMMMMKTLQAPCLPSGSTCTKPAAVVTPPQQQQWKKRQEERDMLPPWRLEKTSRMDQTTTGSSSHNRRPAPTAVSSLRGTATTRRTPPSNKTTETHGLFLFPNDINKSHSVLMERNTNNSNNKRVQFADPIVTAVRVRPVTKANEVRNLFFDPSELDVLSHDRANRIPDEQFECIATSTGNVSVRFPRVRVPK
ncbi:hypothetical protein MHU86_1940 [Fragilaria crotonensis]|nr:hypothetical protein MHU86_1940 [Fragilaria crotonensis]